MKAYIEVENAKHMRQIGAQLASYLQGGEVIGLAGPLGAGKTTLTQGLLEHFGIVGSTSPTFVIDSVYEISDQNFRELHHVDLYRIENPSELTTIGFFEQVGRPEFVYIIEWFNRFPNLIDKGKLYIEITGSGDKRSLKIEADDEKYDKFFEKLTSNI